MEAVNAPPKADLKLNLYNLFKKDDADWMYTSFAIDYAKRVGFYEEPDKDSPKGKYQGRDIIGRNTRVNMGVYLGGSDEAIVVDDVKTDTLLKTYNKLLDMREAAKSQGKHFKDGILEDVFLIASEALPYSLDRVDKINQNHNVKYGDKVSLSVYIDEKAGVCRHQALLAGYLLEKLVDDGYLRGQVSVERNFVKDKGGHVWVRYTTHEGKEIIIDPAQHFIGYLEDVDPEDRWFYKRPKSERILRAVKKWFK